VNRELRYQTPQEYFPTEFRAVPFGADCFANSLNRFVILQFWDQETGQLLCVAPDTVQQLCQERFLDQNHQVVPFVGKIFVRFTRIQEGDFAGSKLQQLRTDAALRSPPEVVADRVFKMGMGAQGGRPDGMRYGKLRVNKSPD
jgi:hypothetical protein